MELTPSVLPGLSPRPLQRIRPGAQMRLDLRVLQMPRWELKSRLREEMAANPFLDPAESDAAAALLDKMLRERVFSAPARGLTSTGEESDLSAISAGTEASLREHLLSQWRLSDLTDLEARVGREIIEDLDERGYLVSPLSAIARDRGVSVLGAENILKKVQGLDPAGVACRSLEECLLIQIDRFRSGRMAQWMRAVVKDHLQDLMRQRWKRIARALGVSEQELRQIASAIRTLNPRPGSAFGAFQARTVVPDVIFQRKRGGYRALCNKKELPGLKIRPLYQKLLNDPRTPSDVRRYLKEKLRSALSWIRALEKRESTLERVAKCLAGHQAGFIARGGPHLKPFRMQHLARQLGVHKSTVSRAVADKYAQTPRGLLKLKSFFGGDHSIQDHLQVLIKKEDKINPLRDGQIAVVLRSQGLSVARRTVAEFRRKLLIPPSYLRKTPKQK